jgi:hypothetical protein
MLVVHLRYLVVTERCHVGWESVGRLTRDFSGPVKGLASRNPNTENNSNPIGFQTRFDVFEKKKKERATRV